VTRASALTKAAAAGLDPVKPAELASNRKEIAPPSTAGAGLDARSTGAATGSTDAAVGLRGPGLHRGRPGRTRKTRAGAVNDQRELPVARDATSRWLTYPEAAAYCRWSVSYLRNLVCAGQIPVYGKPRVRRFRRDMLDLFLTDPDAAMRSFRAERNAHGS
jgi:hypothetical protein